METRSENEGWKLVLKGAAVNPSPSVWEGIELQLDRDEVVKLRRSVYFYKILAAACVTLALVAFGSAYFNTPTADEKQIPGLLVEKTERLHRKKQLHPKLQLHKNQRLNTQRS
jgi:hypothetical protein